MILFRPKSIAIAVAVAALLLGNSSCNDDTPGDIDRLNGRIAFDVNPSDFGGGTASRGGEASTVAVAASRRDSLLGRIPFVAGADTFMLTVTQSPNTSSVLAQPRLDSRGAPIQDATMPQFTAVALTGENALFFKEKLTVGNDGKAITGRYWPNMPLHFFAYTATHDYGFDPDVNVSGGNYTGSFSYTMPAPDPATNNDATKQPDLIVAITPGQNKQETAVPLRFHHALTAIVFKMGKVEAGTTIQSISLTNLRSSGTCTFAATGSNDVQFTWNNHSGKESYVQTVNKADVKQDDPLTHDQTTFLVVPQDITSETAVNVKFKIEGRGEYNLSGKLNPGGSDPTIISTFQPDTKYTFTLSLAEEIQITVDDKVEGQVKKNVQIQNTGLAYGWIRAVINGYWVNKDGVIVAPWKETDGTFVRADNWKDYWAKDPDTGIYYYKQVVPSGEFTQPLFDTYTLKATAPQVDAVLELNVAAQIIIKTESPDSRTAAGWKTASDWASWLTL